MQKIQYKTFFISVMLLAAGCKPELNPKNPEKGEVNAARFVAVGGSGTAGFSDGAYYREGQENSLANILAGQFKLIGGGDFSQPWISESSAGIGFTGKSRSVLGYKTDCLGVTSLSPVSFASAGDMGIFGANLYAGMGPFGNMAVPGLKATELEIAGYGNAANGAGNYNPFFARMASAVTASVLSDAMSQEPTFFALYIGEQDILNFASSGGTSPMTPVAGGAGVGFAASVDQAAAKLTANGAKGVIGNVPDVLQYPFFNTVPYNGLVLDAANAASLNTVLGPLGFTFHVGSNAFLVEDPTPAGGQFGVRQLVEGEKILLSVPLDSVKCNKMGSVFPFRGEFVLDLSEIAAIKANTAAYNNAIANTAATYGLALADANATIKSFKTGMIFNGIGVNANFVSGGAFSLDGIHLNPIGQALLANQFIKSINSKFGSTIPQVDATRYRGVRFP